MLDLPSHNENKHYQGKHLLKRCRERPSAILRGSAQWGPSSHLPIEKDMPPSVQLNHIGVLCRLSASMSCHPSPKERAAESHAQLCTPPHTQTREEGDACSAEMHLANAGCHDLLTSPRQISAPSWDGEGLRHGQRLNGHCADQRPGDSRILLLCHQSWLKQPYTATMPCFCPPVRDSAFFTQFNC